MLRRAVSFAFLLLIGAGAQADPQLGSWFTDNSGQYARLYPTTADETSGTAVNVWSRGRGSQALPTYAGVNEVSYSANYVYIRTTGLASHVMGPWYLDAGKTRLFPNFPSNTATIYRFPRQPTIPATKTNTGLGPIGYFVNGVAFFDNRDSFSYAHASGADAAPMNGLTGDGIWNRDAYANERVTFDAALAHQAGNQYHYHVQPIALRSQLGDHVDYNATTNRYTESSTPVSKHSPIVAWAADGLPVYGPYGYSVAADRTSPVRRMVSGYVPRDGRHGTTNLATTGRHSLPAWAALAQGRAPALTASEFGPEVNASYALGHYLEDYDFLGDLPSPGVACDLDRYNCRYCVTPEFPAGTYAYFSTLDATGAPAFPYNIGSQFFGNPTGGRVSSIGEAVTTYFSGGANVPANLTSLTHDQTAGATTVSWSSVDGATYRADSTADFITWTAAGTKVASAGTTTSFTDKPAAGARFYRAVRTALAGYDRSGYGPQADVSEAPSAPASPTATASFTITLRDDVFPPVPPAGVPVESVTFGGVEATAVSRPSRYVIVGTLPFVSKEQAAVRFPPPPNHPEGPLYHANALWQPAK